ncbi:MAG: cupin domain-containing protein [Actinomycetaceae bacterium]|nr:cupin domain-containing protein [Actinomycetaceae bacterium]
MAKTEVSQSVGITDLLDVLPVSDEATTSRVVVNNPLMRVVYFSFDTDQVLTTHSSPRAVVVTLLSGSMDFTIDDTTHHMVSGDCLYLAPGVQHSLIATSPCHMSLVMVDTQYSGKQ